MSESKFINGRQLLEKGLTEIPSLVLPILPKVGLAAVTGSSDTGKSSFLRHLAMSIVLDEAEFLGFRISSTHKSVIYVATEDDEDATAVLIAKAFKTDLEFIDYEKIRFLFETENLLQVLNDELHKAPADLVIIDTYTDIFDGNMNQSNEVRTFLTKYKELAQRHNCLVIFLHHTGKRTENLPPSKDNALGSQGFESKMRVLIEIRRDFKNDKNRHLCVVKGNYLPEEYKNRSYMLEFNDKLQFTATGQRVRFEELARPEFRSTKNNEKAEYINKALALKEAGRNYRQISDEITQLGYKVSRSTVGNWLENLGNNSPSNPEC